VLKRKLFIQIENFWDQFFFTFSNGRGK